MGKEELTLGDILENALKNDKRERNKSESQKPPEVSTIPDNFNDGLDSPYRLPFVCISQGRDGRDLAFMVISPAQARNLAKRLLYAAHAAEEGDRITIKGV